MLVLGIDIVLMFAFALLIIMGEWLVFKTWQLVPPERMEFALSSTAACLLVLVFLYGVMAKVLDCIAGGMWLP